LYAYRHVKNQRRRERQQQRKLNMRLARLFSDNMVLQRDVPAPVWGWAKAGESVTVEMAGNTARTQAGADGKWTASLPAMKAGGPHTLVARGAKTITVENVLVGEVWICSGQSNMEWPLEQARNAKVEMAAANYPEIRMFNVPRFLSRTAAEDIQGSWRVSSPVDAGTFSAAAYFFGRELHRRLGVPVGLINSSWGGTVAQTWVSREGLSSEPALSVYIGELKRSLDVPEKEAEKAYLATRAEFLTKLPQDQGNRGLAEGWANLEYDDKNWKTMELPQYWQSAGHATNGVFWFRLIVDVPAAWAGHDLQLNLGAVDKSDDTYFNGQRVGGLTWAETTNSWKTPREYVVPAKAVRPGRNVIAVRVLSNYTGGGIVGPGTAMLLLPKNLPGAKFIELDGRWRYQIEQDYGPVRTPAEPAPAMGQNVPTVLFNSMISPLVPYALRGAIWYQGESNADDAARYHTLFPTLIRDWRRCWKMNDMSFFFVQLANYGQNAAKESDDSRWAELREAQAAARALPHTGMAVAIDIGEPNDIHPRNKQDVGLRLALNALAMTYGQKVEHCGPQYRALKKENGALRLEFDHADGLTARDGEVKGFAVAGKDRVFHVAAARVDGKSVVVSSPQVPSPVAARYGWAECPTCTLYNAAGLPVEPFRTDNWPVGVKPA
jgi:sialate O-acetylesterase